MLETRLPFSIISYWKRLGLDFYRFECDTEQAVRKHGLGHGAGFDSEIKAGAMPVSSAPSSYRYYDFLPLFLRKRNASAAHTCEPRGEFQKKSTMRV